MRRRVLSVIVVIAAGCSRGPAIVGNAYAPGTNQAVKLVQLAVDSGAFPATIILAPWTSKNALVVRSESEQAATFAATKDLVEIGRAHV